MLFKTHDTGADYIHISMNVHRDQLLDVAKALTGAPGSTPGGPVGAEQDDDVAATVEGVDDRQPPRWLWNLLTEDLRGLPDPRCVVCDRAVSFRDRKSARGALFAVAAVTREACVACRKCVAHGRSRTLAAALRPVDAASVLTGELAGVRVPAFGGEVHVVRAGQMPAHVVLAPLVGDGGDGDVEVRGGHVGRVDPDHLGFAGVPSVLEPEAAGAVRGAGSGEAQQEPDVPLGISVEAEDQGRVGEGDLQTDGVNAHGGSFGGCRCAGAAQADAQGVTEPTERPASLEDVVELLREVLDAMPGKPIGVKLDRSTRGGAWLIAADGTAEEDDTEPDCEGPGAEGVDGGEDR